MVKKGGLGKGLEALLRDVRPLDAGEFLCEVSLLRPNPLQPRKEWDPQAMQELIDSIREKGVLQPILVRPKGDGYEIIAGERRWRAAIEAGLDKVPVIVKEVSDKEALELALVENLQRQDLNPLEEAEAYRVLIEEFGYTQQEVAQKVGKDRSTVANALRLLKLSPEAKEALRRGQISAGHARVLLSIEDPEQQRSLLRLMVEKGISVREAERLASKEKKGKRTSFFGPVLLDPDLLQLQEEFQSLLGLKVRIRLKGQKGKIEVEFNNLEELERVLELLRGGGG